MSLAERQPWRPRRAAIIGTGLLGGSVGLALRSVWPDLEVVGYSRRPETREAAVRIGAATSATADLQDACRESDLVVVGTPVTLIADQTIAAAGWVPDDAVITDVGSTKSEIVRRVEQDPRAASKFVGSHPIAGSEKTGPEHARADLFRDRPVVVTPTPRSDAERLERVTDIWRAVGATVLSTTPEQHDEFLAATSHLPHLVAAALASIIPPDALPFVGAGWRDTTRIAAGCPEIWSAICRENSAAIADQLQRLIASLGELHEAVAAGEADAIRTLLRQGRDVRNRVEQGAGGESRTS